MISENGSSILKQDNKRKDDNKEKRGGIWGLIKKLEVPKIQNPYRYEQKC